MLSLPAYYLNNTSTVSRVAYNFHMQLIIFFKIISVFLSLIIKLLSLWDKSNYISKVKLLIAFFLLSDGHYCILKNFVH